MLVASGKRYVRADGVKGWPLAGSRRREVGRANVLDLVGVDLFASYAAIYASQPFVYSLVNKLARGIGRLPIRTFEWLDEDANEKEETRTSPLARLLHRPFPRGSRRKLVEALIGSVAVYAHGYAWKYRPGQGRAPTELWPLDSRFVTFEVGPNAPVGLYRYRVAGIEKKILPEDMLHLTWWSPKGERGTSPLEPLRRTLSLEDAATRYAVASFANGVRPSGALIAQTKLDAPVKRELQAEIDEIHSGPDNAFRMLLLEGGLDWKAFSMSAADAQTVEMRKLGFVEACAVYDIPPPVVHLLDHATFSNITEQNKALYRESLSPWLGLFEGDFDAMVIDDEPAFAGQLVEFDLREVLRADLGERAEAYARLLSVYTPNELRGQEGLTPIDHPAADTILIPLNMVPALDGAEFGPGLDDETQALAAYLVSALKNRNGHDADAKSLIDRLLSAAA